MNPKDLLNINTLASLAPVAGGLYVMTHMGSIVGGLAAITVGAAVVKHGQAKAQAEREAKAIEAAAKERATLAEQNGQAIEERVADALREFRALPQTAQTTLDERIAQMRNRAQTIDYTNASREVTRRV